MSKIKKRVVWLVTVEGNVDLFDLLKESIRALEISGTKGKVKVIGIRDQKVKRKKDEVK